ncbi:MAG: hypothetical protein JNM69_03675 [Archangium sp.]|nr:hypothetical protein [Archangium sp.]
MGALGLSAYADVVRGGSRGKVPPLSRMKSLPLTLMSSLLAAAVFAQDAAPHEERRGIALSDRLVLDADSMSRLPGETSTNDVLARVFLPSLFALEESMGFSDIEHERFSLAGNSPLWSEFHLEDFNVTDPFFDGASAFKVPTAFLSELELLAAESPFHRFGGGLRYGVTPRPGAPARRARVSFGVGGVGGTIPGAEPISDFITTKHTRNRATPPEEDRRRFLGRLQASLLDTEAIGSLTLRSALEVDGNVRHHQSFPTAVREQAGVPFDERTLRVSGIAELTPADRAWRAYVLSEFRQRDNLFTERRYARDETLGLRSGGVLLGFTSGGFHAGLTYKHDRLSANAWNFSREVLDVDGEGFFPFHPTGAMNSVRVDLGYRAHDAYVSSDTRVLGWTGGTTQQHALTLGGAPVGSVTVGSTATTTVVGSHRVGYARAFRWRHFELAVDGYAVVNHANAAGTSGLFLPDVGAEVMAIGHVTPWFQPFLAVGRTPIGVTSQTALALTPGAFTATTRRADGRLVQTFGGDVTSIGQLQGPSILSATFGITSQLGPKWKFSGQALAKAWHGLARLTFDGAPEQYGHFSGGVFFFDGAPTRYRLVNDPLNETPYGGQVQLELSRVRDENGFFSAGFSAANFFGHPPFGNGAFGNDIGLVDWLGANPNARYRSLSNTDADRAFILKVAGGLRLWRALWGSFTVFYKDGQPFGFFDTFVEDGQVATRLRSNRGSAMQISSPLIGWREDFQVEVDLRLGYDFELGRGYQLRAGVVVANVFDLGNEVSERHWAPYDRSALELQLPRSLNLSLELLGP